MKKLSIFIIGAALILAGCSKSFYDINKNPNSPDNASADLVFANALKVTAGFQNTTFTVISEWMAMWAPSGSYALSATDGASYKQTTTFGDAVWTAYYRNLQDYDYVEKTAAASGQNFYVAGAKTMKALLFSQLVDLFNNVPYSQALQGANNFTPAYDKGIDIYTDLSTQLGTAVSLFQRADAVGSLTQDILFGSKMGSAWTTAQQNAAWAQFANSLRLRLLLRQTAVAGRVAYIQTEINKIVANGSGFLTVNAGVNPGYSNSTGKQNPFYAFCYNTAGTMTQDFWRASKYTIDFCQANGDPRHTRWFQPIPGGTYVGCEEGASGNPVGSLSSTINGPGTTVSVSQDAPIMTVAESNLLQAEASLRGYLGVSALSMFNSGVQASFSFLGAGSSATYTSQNNKKTSYSACGTDVERLNVIMIQQYLASVSILPLEAYANYRRTGLPADIPLTKSSFVDVLKIPYRWLYPISEYNYNTANVNAEGTIDHHTSKIFWMP